MIMLCIGPYDLDNVLKLRLITKFQQNHRGIMFYMMNISRKFILFHIVHHKLPNKSKTALGNTYSRVTFYLAGARHYRTNVCTLLSIVVLDKMHSLTKTMENSDIFCFLFLGILHGFWTQYTKKIIFLLIGHLTCRY